MTISIKPTASGSTIEQDGSQVLSIESDRSVDIDSGTLHVDAANNRVGIGTSSPATNLVVNTTGVQGLQLTDTSTDSSPRILFTNDTNTWGVYNNVEDLSFRSGATIGSSSGTERMRIDSGGNVMIGTTSTNSFMLNVVAPDTSRAIGAYRQTTSTTYLTLGVFSNVTATNTNHFRVDADGDVRNTNNSYGALSDQTIKQQIVDANSQLEDIKAVQVRKYKLNSEVEAFGDDAPIHIGGIAQELESAGMSGLVDEDEETNLKSVKYSVLYLKALKALQEAITKIEDLETRIEALEAK